MSYRFYRQTSIAELFTKMKENPVIEKERVIKKIYTSLIEVSDDSDSENVPQISEALESVEVTFSDDEDGFYNCTRTNIKKEEAIDNTTLMRTYTEIMGVNPPGTKKMQPKACSTPLKVCNDAIPSLLESSNSTSNALLQNSNSSDANTSSDSNKTIICELSPNTTIKILNNTLLKPQSDFKNKDSCLSVTQKIVDNSNACDKKVPIKRALFEDRGERSTKKHKINEENSILPKKTASETIWLSKSTSLSSSSEKSPKKLQNAANKTQASSSKSTHKETVSQKRISTDNTIFLKNMNSPSKQIKLDVGDKESAKKTKISSKETQPSCSKKIVSPKKILSENANLSKNTNSPSKVVKLDVGNEKSAKKLKTSAKEPQASCSKKIGKTAIDNNSVLAKNEHKKINMQYAVLIKDILKVVQSKIHLKNIIGSEDLLTFKNFLEMDQNGQYLCMKLFTWKQRWYNIFKFCKLVHLELEDHDVVDLRNVLLEKKFVENDYTKESPETLLNILDLQEVRKIYSQFKLSRNVKTKEKMIESLLKACKTQSTLTFSMSLENLLQKRVNLAMGDSVRFRKTVFDAFFHVYLLGTFVNHDFSEMSDYFNIMLSNKVVFPQFTTEDFIVFNSKEDFLNYAESRKCQLEVEKARSRKDFMELYQIGEHAFENLQKLQNSRTNPNDISATHLSKFSAEYVYVSVISNVSKCYISKYPEKVQKWLLYLINNCESFCESRIGDWYDALAWNCMLYLEPRNYIQTAQLLIKVLEEKRDKLSDVQLHEIGVRSKKLNSSRKYKIDQLYHDKIANLIPRPIKDSKFPSIIIDATAVRSNDLGKKRNYVVYNKEGDKHILHVEEIALHYYSTNGDFPSGLHCEGRVIKALFTLFFWDLIYDFYVPKTFLLKIQMVPLDMYSKNFYLNRKLAVDQRVGDISSGWSEECLWKFVAENWRLHSHESSLCEVGGVIESEDFLGVFVGCIGREVLAKIFQRFVQDVRVFQSGLPDLLLWNEKAKKCKFVEVKGENDYLSTGQKLWLKYLESVGADIEVCHVHSTGSKKKKLPKKSATDTKTD